MNSLSWMVRVGKRVILSFLACLLISMVFLGSDNALADNPDHIYYTQGAHNDLDCDKSKNYCVADRHQGEPSDPQYPQWWISDWKMYRVFQNYDKFPPPYSSPPQDLNPDDYEVSDGTTYYDSTYIAKDGDGEGAMIEHYKKRCLPVFPSENHYTCSFVSLGNKAYFLRYDDLDLTKKPSICLFSPHNHPPRTDFIKHLSYDPTESAHLNNSLQAYSIHLSDKENPKKLFGYAFYKEATPDSYDSTAKPYRHPQSFYFAGYPLAPVHAPIVSQNYTSFHIEKPSSETWTQIAEMLPPNPKPCCLFESDCPKKSSSETLQPVNNS